MNFRLLSPLVALALFSAGCFGSTAEVEETPAAVEAEPLPAEVPIALDGAMALNVVACPVVTCVGRSLVGGDDRFFEQQVSGNLSRINLTATWTPSSPLTESLYFGVFTCTDPCDTDATITQEVYVEGPSPLTLEATDFVVPEGERFFIFAWTAFAAPLPVYATATTPQEFHVGGSLTPAS